MRSPPIFAARIISANARSTAITGLVWPPPACSVAASTEEKLTTTHSQSHSEQSSPPHRHHLPSELFSVRNYREERRNTKKGKGERDEVLGPRLIGDGIVTDCYASIPETPRAHDPSSRRWLGEETRELVSAKCGRASTRTRHTGEDCKRFAGQSSLRVRRAAGRHDSHVSPSIPLADNAFLRRTQEELRFQQHQQGRHEGA